MFGRNAAHFNISANCRRRAGDGGGDYSVRYNAAHGVPRRGEACNDDGVAPRACYVRAEGAQIVLQGAYLRLARRAVDNGFSPRGARGEHDVLRRADAGKRQGYLRPVQL